jgi:hypothetical protein
MVDRRGQPRRLRRFGVAAVTSLVEPADDEPVSAAITNAATTLGALGFLAGAILPALKRR